MPSLNFRNHGYEQLDQTASRNHTRGASDLKRKRRSIRLSPRGRVVVPVILFFTASLLIFWVSLWRYDLSWASSGLFFLKCSRYTVTSLDQVSCDDVNKGFQCRTDISHFWGQYSPFFSVPSEISPDLPSDCQLTAVQVLSRHGARFPTFAKSAMYATIIQRIQRHVDSFPGKYAFLKDYEYGLGSDDLTAFGQQEMFNSGVKFYERYRSLTSKGVPFIRASDQGRVVQSAQNFSQGFHHARSNDQGEDNTSDSYPYRIVKISEDGVHNNTLNHGLCDAFEDGPASDLGGDKAAEWLSHFAPKITQRLNRDLPGADLFDQETVDLMDMCAFETVASPNGTLSPFCDLFTPQEFREYDYLKSVSKYYGFGNGNPLGPTQGVGYVNEVIARLTSKPVHDHTTVNHTMDADPRMFPIGSQANILADFTHDKYVVRVLRRCISDP